VEGTLLLETTGEQDSQQRTIAFAAEKLGLWRMQQPL
jgi:hypothetical protein